MGRVRKCPSSHEVAAQQDIPLKELVGKPKWLPLNIGYHDDVLHPGPTDQLTIDHDYCLNTLTGFENLPGV